MTDPAADPRLDELVADLDAVVWEAEAPSGRFTFVSGGATRILGYPPEAFLDDPDFWAEHIHPEDRETAVKEFVAGIESGRAHDTEYRFVRSDGAPIWIRDVGHAVLDAGGRPTGVRGVWTDIDRRKVAEEHRGETEQRYQRLVEQLPGMVYLEDADEDNDGPGRFLYVSPNVKHILGYTIEEWLEDPTGWVDRLHPDDLPKMRAAYRAVATSGAPYSLDYRMFAKDGRIVWIHDEAVLVRDERGTPMHWQGVMLDTTAQHMTEEQPEGTQTRYQGLVENLPAIAYTESIRDTDGGIVYMSPQARDLLGFEPEELTGPPEQWLQVVHPEDRDRVREQNQHSDATGEPFVIEYRIVGRDGRVRWVHDESRLVRDDDGVPRFWQGVMFDITRRMDTEHLERELEAERQEAAELRALDELKNTFLQAVSHDLRTPLAAILGLAVTLERQEGLPPEDARDLAARIATNARKLDRMVTDLLDLERLSRGIVEPKLRWIDVGALARRVVEESEVVSGREVDVRSSEVFARVDAAKVERILENLLSNAVRHTPAGTRLWVRVGPEGGGVLLVVEDEGPGVPPAIREAIFQPFQRGLGASEYSPGVGIGLTLVARFAELHGGRAWVHDREGGGASFQVWLPAGEPDAPLPD